MSPRDHELIRLAREAIRVYVATGEILEPAAAPDDAPSTGVFVSLHERATYPESEGPLRGCVGTVEPREPTLRREIARSAVAAAVSDPRFPPLLAGQIDDLAVTIYLLEEPEPIGRLEDLDPERFGVIVTGPGGRTGLLLPAIPGITDAADQVDIARQKALLAPDDPILLSRFAARIIR